MCLDVEVRFLIKCPTWPACTFRYLYAEGRVLNLSFSGKAPTTSSLFGDNIKKRLEEIDNATRVSRRAMGDRKTTSGRGRKTLATRMQALTAACRDTVDRTAGHP